MELQSDIILFGSFLGNTIIGEAAKPRSGCGYSQNLLDDIAVFGYFNF